MDVQQFENISLPGGNFRGNFENVDVFAKRFVQQHRQNVNKEQCVHGDNYAEKLQTALTFRLITSENFPAPLCPTQNYVRNRFRMFLSSQIHSAATYLQKYIDFVHYGTLIYENALPIS